MTIYADYNLESTEVRSVTYIRSSQLDKPMNTIGEKKFMTFNASINWLGTKASLLCANYASYLQQKMPSPTVGSLICLIKKLVYSKGVEVSVIILVRHLTFILRLDPSQLLVTPLMVVIYVVSYVFSINTSPRLAKWMYSKRIRIRLSNLFAYHQLLKNWLLQKLLQV